MWKLDLGARVKNNAISSAHSPLFDSFHSLNIDNQTEIGQTHFIHSFFIIEIPFAARERRNGFPLTRSGPK